MIDFDVKKVFKKCADEKISASSLQKHLFRLVDVFFFVFVFRKMGVQTFEKTQYSSGKNLEILVDMS